MKCSIAVFTCLLAFVTNTNFAQNEIPQLVGAGGNGSIYRLSNGQAIDLFQLNKNQRPEELELVEVNGVFWGITKNGGDYNKGTIFKTDEDGSGYIKMHDFSVVDGAFPTGSLIELDGKLWGLTEYGGSNDFGTIFKIELDGSGYEVVHEFGGIDGRTPRSSLLSSNGKLWGTTYAGGSRVRGIIFSYEPGNGFNNEHEFEFGNGSNPSGKLVESNGRLWGITSKEGSSEHSVIYSIGVDGNDFRVDFHFESGIDGSEPISGLTVSNNKLFGHTINSIFAIENTGENFITIYNSEPDVSVEFQGRFLAHNNKLWGVSYEGGDHHAGFIYNLNEDGSDFTNLYSFKNIDSDGRNPWCTLVEYNGRLWGSTTTGGTKGNGTIFSIADDGTDYGQEISFIDVTYTGWQPNGFVIEANNHIVGTTLSGGYNDYGVIFSLSKDGTEYNVLHHFSFTDGTGTSGALVEIDGKLWGLNSEGGANNKGTIFSIDIDGSNFTKAHDFNGIDGDTPVGGLIVSDGLLWGVTANSNNGAGNIFKYNPNTGIAESVIDFDPLQGLNQPQSGLTKAYEKFYCITKTSTSSVTYQLYNFDLDGNNFNRVYQFNEFFDNVRRPSGLLVLTDVNLWGVDFFGGTFRDGSLFSFEENGTLFKKQYDFNFEFQGSRPIGGLTFFNNKLYGVIRNSNLIFSINTDGTGYQSEAHINFDQVFHEQGGLLAPVVFNNSTPTDLLLNKNSINENLPPGSTLGQLTATDEDNDANIFSLETSDGISDADNSSFEIVDNELKTLQSFNYEEKSVYSIFVRTTDSFGETFEKGFLITVNDINEAPSIENESFSIDEGSEVSAVVGNLGSTDPEDNDITYTIISGNTDNAFSISADGNLIVTNASAIDFEENAEFALTVEVSDGELVNEGVLIISLNDINEAPIIGNQSFTIDEGSEASTVVGNLGASDPEEDVISYSITSGNTNDAFSIDVDGNLVVNNSSAIDFEATPEFTLSVELSDGNLVTESAVTITLNDINFAPTDILLSSTSFDENSDEGTIVGQLSATDEPGDTGSFTLVAGDGTNDVNNSSFEIIGNDIKTLESFNYEEKNEYFILIRATDSFGEIFEKEFTISVNDINEAPIVEDKGFTIPEGSETGTVVGNIEATDEDNDELSFSITTGNTGATFSITADGEIIVDTPSALDFDTTPTFNLVVEVSDGELASEVNVEITLEQVTGIEDLPEGFSIYPNPAKNQLQIESLKSFTAEILNQAGQTVLEETSNNVIDVSILKSGLYILKLKHDNKVETVRFIKE
jgi:uncharacterized repeat protein (TIGR03803 family)